MEPDGVISTRQRSPEYEGSGDVIGGREDRGSQHVLPTRFVFEALPSLPAGVRKTI